MAPKKFMRKRRGKKSKARRHPISRGMTGVPDVASLTESITNRNPNSSFYNTNTSYRLYNISLSILPRASVVGQAYQEYRIRRITVVWKPTQDTFTGVNNVVPQLYYMVDKKGAVPSNFTIDTLTQMGSVPRRFDDKSLKVSWTPAVLQATLTDPGALTTGVASAQISPWLPTNNAPGAIGYVASDVDHFGLSWQANVPGGAFAVGYDVDVFVDVEFRKPRFNPVTTPSGPTALDWNHKLPAV